MARSKKKGIMISRRVIDSIKVDIGNSIGSRDELIFKNKPMMISINFNDIYNSDSFFVEDIRIEYEAVCNGNVYESQKYIKKNKKIDNINMRFKIDNNNN